MSKEDKKHPLSEIMVYIGIAFFTIMLFAMMFLLDSCCSPKTIEKVETKIEYRDRIIKDTVTFEVPKEVIKNVTTDTTSIVETSFAKSEAKVSNGLLYHSIENKEQAIQKPVIVHVTDTLYVSDSSSQEIPEPEIKYVDKELTWWQRVRLDTYVILLAIIAGYILIKYRKGLFSLIKLFI